MQGSSCFFIQGRTDGLVGGPAAGTHPAGHYTTQALACALATLLTRQSNGRRRFSLSCAAVAVIRLREVRARILLFGYASRGLAALTRCPKGAGLSGRASINSKGRTGHVVQTGIRFSPEIWSSVSHLCQVPVPSPWQPSISGRGESREQRGEKGKSQL